MSLEAARAEMTSLIQAALTAESIATPIEYPNTKLVRPEAAAWMRLTLQTGATVPTAIGDRTQKRSRTPVQIVLQVFLPEESGTQLAYQIHGKLGAKQLDYSTSSRADTDTLTTAFVNLETMAIAPIGVSEGFQQFNLTMPGTITVTATP